MKYDLTNQSPELTQFYAEMLKWIDAGTPYHPAFSPYVGLCCNWSDYLGSQQRHASFRELIQQFREAGLCGLEPFGNDFVAGQSRYTNTARVNWVRDHVPDLT